MIYKTKLYSLTALLSVFSLAGCASTGNDAHAQSTPHLGQNSPAIYVQANSPAVQKQVVTQYVPVPIPGQLMPTPTAANAPATPNFSDPAQAVDYANKNATEGPSASSFFNSMMTYDYTDGALYTIYSAPLKITDIALQPGEKLISEAAGDTLRWQIAQTYSGSGGDLTQHILVKPNQADLTNTMVITTDQRVYHLVLISTNDSYMASVEWNYGNSMVTYAQNNQNGGSNPFTNPSSSSPDVDLSQLDFNYQFGMAVGEKPDWYPTRIFNDGKQTFIQLPNNYSASQMPVLYVADETGTYGTMINWRYRTPYIVVDAVLQKARLQSGVGKTGQTVVQIQHN